MSYYKDLREYLKTPALPPLNHLRKVDEDWALYSFLE
jgi:hypothetical protein